MKNNRYISILVLGFLLFASCGLNGQLANVTYSHRINSVFGFVPETCGLGGPDYHIDGSSNDDVDLTARNFNIAVDDWCTNCMFGSNVLIYTWTNTSAYVNSINSFIREDGGGFCNSWYHGYNITGSTFFRNLTFPSPPGTYASIPFWIGSNEWYLDRGFTWLYTGNANQIIPTTTAQSASYGTGKIWSWSVPLNVGICSTYVFGTCGSTGDTYLRLYGPDGYTVVAQNDNGCGNQSQITYSPTVSGTYYLEVSDNVRSSVSNGGSITYQIYNAPPTVANGTQTICSGSSAILGPITPSGGISPYTYSWSGGLASTNNPTTPTLSGSTSYIVTVTDVCAASNTASSIVNVVAPPTTAVAGPDQTICISTATMAANTALSGTGSWSIVSGLGVLGSGGSPTTTVTGLGLGPNTFRWTISNPPCTASFDDIVITRLAAPTVDAGPDQQVCGGNATMAGNNTSNGNWIVWVGTGNINSPTSPFSAVSSLGVGANTLRWTVSSSFCADQIDDVVIINQNPPPTPNAGNDTTVCGTVFSLRGSVLAPGSTGMWTSIPPGITILNPTTPNANAIGLTPGPHVFRWTITAGVCPIVFDEVTVTKQPSAPTADAGGDSIICGATYNLQGNTAFPGTGTWTSVFGGATVVSSNSANSTVTNLASGVNFFRWDITDAPCPNTSDAVQITRMLPPSTADAGADQLVCTSIATLKATTPTSGTGTWTAIPAGPIIAAPNSPITSVSGLPFGTTTMRWNVANAPCIPNFDDMVIVRLVQPVVDAGPDISTCTTIVSLNAVPPSIGTGVWTLASGTGTISNPNSPSTTVTVLGVGANTFRWTVTDSVCGAVADSVVVTQFAAPTAVGAGPDQTICATSAVLQADPLTVGTGMWSSLVPGPAIISPTSQVSAVNNLAIGPNYFRWTVSNGVCTPVADDVTINVVSIPTAAFAGFDAIICDSVAILNGNIPTSGTGMWSQIVGSGTIITTTNPVTAVSGLAPGPNFFRWTISNSPCPVSIDEVRITRSVPLAPANAGPDINICSATYSLNATAPTVGTGIWTVVSGPGTLMTPTLPNSGISGLSTVTPTKFLWTVSNPPCASVSDTVIVTRLIAPTSDAGFDQIVCSNSTVLLGNAPTSGATGTWSLVFGNGSFSNANNAITLVAGLASGDNYFRWSINGGTCPATDDLVRITFSPPPSIANAGGDDTICGTTAILTANQPTVGTGLWTLTSGAGTILSPTNHNTLVTGLGPGTNYFTWTITNPPCPPSSDIVAITREATPITANAGPDQTLCSSNATLAGNLAPTYGGTWALVAGAGTVTNPSLPGSTVTGLGAGPNTFRWTVNNGVCPSTFDDVVITRNLPPSIANAGSDSIICGTTFTLNGNLPLIGTGLWTLVAGGGAVTSPTAYNSGITSIGGGSNTFRWTISNGVCPASIDDVIINRIPAPSVSNAGPNQTVCDSNAVLNADPPLIGTGFWTLVGGSGTIVNPLQRNSNVTQLGIGINTFRWTVSNGTCTPSIDDVTITRSAYPSSAYAGADQTICSDTVVMVGNVPTVGVGIWSLSSGAGVFANASSPTTLVTGLAVGANTFVWTISNSICPVRTDAVTIIRDQRPTVANAGPDQARCSNAATLTANSPTVGAGSWTLIGGSGNIAQPTNFTTAVTNLGLGPNTFRWTIVNGVCPPSEDDVVITRDNTPPVAICRNVTLYLDNAGVAQLTIPMVDSNSTDNCAIATRSLSMTAFLCANLGPNGVTLVLADSNGNSSSCNAIITVRDSIHPSIGCPSTQYVLLNSNCAGALPNYLPIGSASDNCSQPPAFVQSPTGGSPITGVGTQVVTLTATDGSGNTSTCSFNVLKQDSIAPAIQCPLPYFLRLDSNCTAVLPNYTDSTTATDNCTGVLTRTQIPVPGTLLSNPGFTNVLVTIADASNNIATCSFSVLKRDLIAPSITCVDTIMAVTDSGLCTAVVVYILPIGTDNCQNPQTTLTSGLGSGSTFSLGPHPEVYTVRDSSGNTSSCTIIVNVHDDQPPMITNCPQPITVSIGNPSCAQVANWLLPSANDNCVLPSFISNYSPLDTFPVGITLVRYIAIDGSGNRDTCEFTVTVLDVGPPSIICPPDTAVVPPNWGPSAVVTFPAPTATDACAPTTSIALVSGIASGGTFPAGITVNTYVATDTSGNTDTCSFTVTVLQKVTVFPYCWDSEAGPGDWVSGGVNSSWEYGIIPSYPGDAVWATSLNSNYNNNERSWAQSPTFDMTLLKKPMASFEYLDQTQGGSDGVVLQASTDNGLTWTTVGGLGTGKKWYNQVNIAAQPGLNNAVGVGWSGSAANWTKAAVRLDRYIGQPQVSFRFQLGSDAFGTTFGFAFDDFCIQERQQNVLHELFANDQNPQSLTSATNLYGLINQNQLDAVMVEYHLQDQLLLPQAPARGSYYQVPSPPWMIVDGNRYIGLPGNQFWNQDDIYARIFEAPIFVFDTLHFNPAFPGGVISPTAQIRYVADGVLGDSLSLQIVVVERVLTSAGHAHEWVMRQMIPLSTGTTILKQWRRDTIAVVSGNWTLQNITSQAEIGVVAFVQNKITKEIYQAQYVGADGPTVGATEAQAADEDPIQVYPNPIVVGAGVAILHVSSERAVATDYVLMNALGQAILQGSSRSAQFEIALERIPSGTYFLRMQQGKRVVMRKVLVLGD